MDMEKAILKQAGLVPKRGEEQTVRRSARLKTIKEEKELGELCKKVTQEMTKDPRQRFKIMGNLKLSGDYYGHGTVLQYGLLMDEKSLYDVCKGSERVIVHFFRKSSLRCKIVDMHLKCLATKHIETRFCKIDANKSAILCERLSITVLPTLLLLKDASPIGRLIGFSDFDNKDDFSTELLEWVVAQYDMIHYDGDKEVRPTGTTQKLSQELLQRIKRRKLIRRRKHVAQYWEGKRSYGCGFCVKNFATAKSYEKHKLEVDHKGMLPGRPIVLRFKS